MPSLDPPVVPVDDLPSIKGYGDGLLVNQCDNSGCCGNGSIACNCEFTTTSCGISWSCDESIQVRIVKQSDSTVVFTGGNVGEIELLPNDTYIVECKDTYGSGDKLRSLQRQDAQAPIVALHLMGQPDRQ